MAFTLMIGPCWCVRCTTVAFLLGVLDWNDPWLWKKDYLAPLETFSFLQKTFLESSFAFKARLYAPLIRKQA